MSLFPYGMVSLSSGNYDSFKLQFLSPYAFRLKPLIMVQFLRISEKAVMKPT